MKLSKYGLNSFLNNVKNKQIICWGAGIAAQLSDEIFLKLDILDRILCFADNDLNKRNNKIKLLNKLIPILSLEDILKIDMKDIIILITCENYIPIYEQLNRHKEFDKVECYPYIYLNKSYYETYVRYKNIVKASNCEKLLIPKTIHYIWFGKNVIPEFHKKCIKTWKKYCPDYEIVQWNEDNYDINKVKYVKQAYDSKKWAFATDYARLDILYNYGGVYFDTDVELIRNIDDLLTNRAFCVFGEWPAINSGSGIGSIKHHPIIKEMRDNPRSKSNFFIENDYYDLTPNAVYESNVLKTYGLKKDFSFQKIHGMMVYPTEVIAPVSVIGEDIFVTDNTYGIHHCKGSWLDDIRLQERELSKQKK